MKEFFDGIINIPANRKAGKYLQKVYPDIKDLSGLVKSLSYKVVELELSEFEMALTSCYSCQSRYFDSIQNFQDFWSKQKNVILVALIDDEKNILARCLINPARGNKAPSYGAGHYMLDARLDFAGYELGSLTDTKKIVEKIKPISTTPPKSPTIESILIWIHPGQEPKRLFTNIQTEYIPYPQSVNERCINRELDKMREYKIELARYNRAFKKYGEELNISYGRQITVRKTKLVHIMKDYVYKEESRYRETSTIYIDAIKKFIDLEIIVEPGYYKKGA